MYVTPEKAVQAEPKPDMYFSPSGLAVTRDPSDDNLGICFPERINIKSPLIHCPCPEILNYNIAFFNQLQKQLPALLGMKVEGYALFVSSQVGPTKAFPIHQRPRERRNPLYLASRP